MTRRPTPRPFWTSEDIHEWIADSTLADWEAAFPPEEHTFKLGSLVLKRPSPPPHDWMAVYLPHPQLKLFWGRQRGRVYEPAWQAPRWGPAEPKLAEVFWKGLVETRGTSVEQYHYAVVDSERCYVPVPKRAQATKSADVESELHWAITSFEHTLFRLLNDLSDTSASGQAFDEYLREAAIEVTG